MYHNVKNFDPKLPYQNFLSIKKFKKELKFFKDKYGLISNKEEIYEKNKKFFLLLMMDLNITMKLLKFEEKKIRDFFYMYKTVNR